MIDFDAISESEAISEERYRQIFEKSPTPMWVYDEDSLAFLAVNNAACEQYGYRREEFLTLTIEQIRCPDELEALHQALDHLEEGLPFQREWKHRKKDGTEILVEITSENIVLEGHRGRLVQAMDITEKKQMEAQFLRSQRLESIGMLAGGIAHDLNNILSPLLMCVEVLRQKLTDEESHEMIEALETSARRGSDMVRQILSFSRGMEGKRVLIQPPHLFREINRFLRETFPKSIEYRTIVGENAPALVADATQIQQVLLNLCVNARDAMENGGTLTLQARDFHLTPETALVAPKLVPGHYAVLEVTDTGAGMTKDVLAKIFDPFFTTKEIGKGTGLGLSTCNAIVKNHGGQIVVESEPGRGTTFRVFLPAETARVTAPASGTEKLPRGNGELVLIVDDELSIRQISQQTLEAFGYQVLTAETGVDAVAAIAQSTEKVDVVIIDLLMPEMDGMATNEALREFDPTLKIIATSGMVGSDEIAPEQHFDSFLYKPFTAITLLKLIHDVLHPKDLAAKR
ncbi:MAG: ATP-binding protein [Chthoniobacteraceae bacterium]